MKPSELFDIWAPPEVVWSKWAKPILFAEYSSVPAADLNTDPLPRVDLCADSKTALILDLPSAVSVKAGLALVQVGFRPIPLFNGNRGPHLVTIGSSAVVDNDPILAWLSAGAAFLVQHPLPFNAPPAFLLDSRRRQESIVLPGRFDNRWVVFPQDFPSANFLKSQGITQVVLIQENNFAQPQEDLAHVLRRWQEAKLALWVTNLENASGLQPLEVKRPRHFRALWYGVLALFGLRRNSAGGFGSIVPQVSSGGG